MNRLEYLRILITNYINREKPKKSEMKRVFQWRRYLEWKDLTPEEKLSAKRLLLVPVFAYLIIGFFNKNFSLIIMFLVGYLLYKKFEKTSIERK